MMQTASLQTQWPKKGVDQALELKSQKQQKCAKNCTSWSPGGSWWTKLTRIKSKQQYK